MKSFEEEIIELEKFIIDKAKIGKVQERLLRKMVADKESIQQSFMII